MAEDSLAAREKYEEQLLACTRPIEDKEALWRSGTLSDLVVKVGQETFPVHSQYFVNGIRASRSVFKKLINESKDPLPEDKEGRKIIQLDPDFNKEGKHFTSKQLIYWLVSIWPISYLFCSQPHMSKFTRN